MCSKISCQPNPRRCPICMKLCGRRYGEALEDGRFSLRNGTFGKLSESDMALIDAALCRPDDEYAEHVQAR